MPRMLGASNLVDQPIYDTMQLAAVTGQTLPFFTVPVGGVLAGAALKTFAHSNLVQAGRLEAGLNLQIKYVSLSIRPVASGGAAVSLVDVRSILNHSHVNIQFGQVSFLRMPLLAVPPGPAEINYYSNIAAAATEFSAWHGLGSFGNRYALRNPIDLDPNESIQVDLTVPTAVGAVTDVTMVFWGSMRRPVR